MTTEEFSNEFDVLVDSYRRFKDFDNKQNLDSLDFNEYEKSVFLTQAQEDLITSYYTGRNQTGYSFEATEENRRILNELVETQKSTTKISNSSNISTDSVFFQLPENKDLWYIVYEAAGLEDPNLKCTGRQEVLVVPTTHDNYQKTIRNPFRRPNERRVLRLDLKGNVVELVSKYNISDYIIRYVSKPEPIILATLPNNLKINGVNVKTECKINTVLQRTILERAVEIAIISKIGITNNQTK